MEYYFLLTLKDKYILGFVIMFHSYYYISLLVSFFNIPVSLGNLFQWIASIYGRLLPFNYSRYSEGIDLGLLQREDVVPIQISHGPYDDNYE